METSQNEPVAQPVVSSASTETTKSNVVDENSRYKSDMFKFKAESRELKERLATYELADEQKKGNYEGVINQLKDEVKNLKHKNAQSEVNFADTQINNAIRNEALTRGIKDVDVLMKLVDTNDKSLIELNEKFEVNSEDVKGLMDKQLDRYGHIFKKEVKIVDAAPNRKPLNTSEKGFNLEGASAEETIAHLLKNKDNYN
jgi:hypothetical protein